MFTLYHPATMKPLAVGLTAAEAAYTMAPELQGILTPLEIIERESGELRAVYDRDWPVILREWQNERN